MHLGQELFPFTLAVVMLIDHDPPDLIKLPPVRGHNLALVVGMYFRCDKQARDSIFRQHLPDHAVILRCTWNARCPGGPGRNGFLDIIVEPLLVQQPPGFIQPVRRHIGNVQLDHTQNASILSKRLQQQPGWPPRPRDHCEGIDPGAETRSGKLRSV